MPLKSRLFMETTARGGFPRTSLHPSVSFILEDQARMAMARNYFAWQGRLVMPELGQRVVEVGCGIGNFTGKLLDREMVVSLGKPAQLITEVRHRYACLGCTAGVSLFSCVDGNTGNSFTLPRRRVDFQ